MSHIILLFSNKRELQQIASNHSSDIYLKDFMKLKNIILKGNIHF